MTSNLTFRSTTFQTYHIEEQIWITSRELAAALEYKDEDAVTRIYNRQYDEFSEKMARTVKLTGRDGKSNTVRIFSLRGAHLIAMLSRTPVAKEFRKWVLDILDKEVGNPVYQPESHELFTANGLC